MRYFMEERPTGWQKPKRTYISRGRALKMISEDRLAKMEQDRRSAYHSTTMALVRGGLDPLYIGVEYDKPREEVMP